MGSSPSASHSVTLRLSDKAPNCWSAGRNPFLPADRLIIDSEYVYQVVGRVVGEVAAPRVAVLHGKWDIRTCGKKFCGCGRRVGTVCSCEGCLPNWMSMVMTKLAAFAVVHAAPPAAPPDLCFGTHAPGHG